MIKSKSQKTVLEIDLTGEQGNAFYLLGVAQRLAKQMKLDTAAIHAEMQASDYENLIQTFDKYFGQYVTLYR